MFVLISQILNNKLLLLTPARLARDDGLVPDLVGPQLGEEAAALLVVDRRLLRRNCSARTFERGVPSGRSPGFG